MTIAAIATAIGPSSIGVVRISGPLALEISSKLTRRNPESFRSHSAIYCMIFDPDTGNELDEAVITAFIAPASYTGEDVVEISCHGSMSILRDVLNACLRSGARMAEPGEFTKRAFLNGKLDLSQAEAVNDLIRSRTEGSRRSALGQLKGQLSGKLSEIDNKLLRIIAATEASIDFPDDVEEPDPDWILEEISICEGELSRLESTFSGGRVLREGARVAIAGSVNVGKSSLLNALLRKERAIVTSIP